MFSKIFNRPVKSSAISVPSKDPKDIEVGDMWNVKFPWGPSLSKIKIQGITSSEIKIEMESTMIYDFPRRHIEFIEYIGKIS